MNKVTGSPTAWRNGAARFPSLEMANTYIASRGWRNGTSVPTGPYTNAYPCEA